MRNIGLILLGLAGLAVLFGGTTASGPPPAALSSTPATPGPAAHRPPATGRFAPATITIGRDETGQFHLDAQVNGAPARLLVDTGADVVALTEADAERAGLVVDPAAYRPILRTASGEGMGARVRIDRLEIGPVVLRDVEAVVAHDLATSLLGQSALARLGRVELSGDVLVIAPPA
ncbi:MAG: TIGR02281 family clan AA aspartic protease [Sphingomonadales bacterium]|nr:TIGR02281 family clan AA aspartic protease [Sphingomonadales bacterium]